MENRIKLGHNSKAFLEAVKNNKAKFEAGENIIDYINTIVGKSGSLKVEDALNDSLKYIRLHFYNVHANSVPSFVKKDKAIDLSDYNETDFIKLVTIYNSINAVAPIDKGKLTHMQPKETDFDLFLDASKKEEYEALKTLLDSANKLTDCKTTYFILDHVRNSVQNRAKFSIREDYTRMLVVNDDFFVG